MNERETAKSLHPQASTIISLALYQEVASLSAEDNSLPPTTETRVPRTIHSCYRLLLWEVSFAKGSTSLSLTIMWLHGALDHHRRNISQLSFRSILQPCCSAIVLLFYFGLLNFLEPLLPCVCIRTPAPQLCCYNYSCRWYHH